MKMSCRPLRCVSLCVCSFCWTVRCYSIVAVAGSLLVAIGACVGVLLSSARRLLIAQGGESVACGRCVSDSQRARVVGVCEGGSVTMAAQLH